MRRLLPGQRGLVQRHGMLQGSLSGAQMVMVRHLLQCLWLLVPVASSDVRAAMHTAVRDNASLWLVLAVSWHVNATRFGVVGLRCCQQQMPTYVCWCTAELFVL